MSMDLPHALFSASFNRTNKRSYESTCQLENLNRDLLFAGFWLRFRRSSAFCEKQ